jgi:hypothetical protein
MPPAVGGMALRGRSRHRYPHVPPPPSRQGAARPRGSPRRRRSLRAHPGAAPTCNPERSTLRPATGGGTRAPTLPRPPPAFPSTPPVPPAAPPPPPRANGSGARRGGARARRRAAAAAPCSTSRANSVPVTKARFVIGRGKQGTDFTIK